MAGVAVGGSRKGGRSFASTEVEVRPLLWKPRLILYGGLPTAISAMKRGADYYLSKPADADQILAVYENLRLAPSDNPETPETVPTLARVEWEHMQRVIDDCGGNISQAARLLGIHRRSLQRKLGKYPPPY